MSKLVQVKYSTEQINALTDSQIYGLPYGFQLGEEEHILSEIKRMGYNEIISSKSDDVHLTHIVEVK